MFCPECKTEYRAGFIRCSDCNAALVDRLPPELPAAPVEHDAPIVIRSYSDELEAGLARTMLDAAGIESMVRSDDCGGMRPHLSFTRGVELLVRPHDVDQANEILSTDATEVTDVDPLQM